MAQLAKESVRFMDWRYEILFEAGLCIWPELFFSFSFFFPSLHAFLVHLFILSGIYKLKEIPPIPDVAHMITKRQG